MYRRDDESSSNTTAEASTQSFAEVFYLLKNEEKNRPAFATITLSAPPRRPNDDPSSTGMREIIHSMATTEVEQIHSVWVVVPTTQAAKKALIEILQTSFHSANDGVKNASFHFVENVLSSKALEGLLDFHFDRNFDRRTHYTSFMDAFAQRVMDR